MPSTAGCQTSNNNGSPPLAWSHQQSRLSVCCCHCQWRLVDSTIDLLHLPPHRLQFPFHRSLPNQIFYQFKRVQNSHKKQLKPIGGFEGQDAFTANTCRSATLSSCDLTHQVLRVKYYVDVLVHSIIYCCDLILFCFGTAISCGTTCNVPCLHAHMPLAMQLTSLLWHRAFGVRGLRRITEGSENCWGVKNPKKL